MYNFVDHRPIPGARYLSGDEIETRRSTYPFDKYIEISDTNLEELKELFASNPSNEYAIVMDKSLSLNKELMEFLAKNSSKNVFYIRENNSSSETTLYDEKETRILADNVNFLRDKYNKDIQFEDGSTIEHALDASRKINEFVEHVNKVKEDGTTLSPLEKYICAYQFVSSFMYKSENEEKENYLTSRNLVSILTGDKIVCEGYAAMLKEICTRLDIPCEIQYLNFKDSNIGHANNLVKINDDKYNVHDSIYYADACWDSKSTKNGKIIPNTFIYAFMDYSDMTKIEPNIQNILYKYSNYSVYGNLLPTQQKIIKLKKEYKEKYEDKGALEKTIESKKEQYRQKYFTKIDECLKDYNIEGSETPIAELPAYLELGLQIFILDIFEKKEHQVSKYVLFDIGKSKNLSREQLKEYTIQYLNEEIDRKVRWETEDEKRKLEGEILKLTDKNRELSSAYYNNTEGRLKPDSIDFKKLANICRNIYNFFEDDHYINEIFDGNLKQYTEDSLKQSFMKVINDERFSKEDIENPMIQNFIKACNKHQEKE